MMTQVTHSSEAETRNDDARHAGPITRRLVYALVLIPIVPAGSFIGTVVADEYIRLASFDDVRWFNVLVSTLCVLCAILIWRHVVVWTLGRKWLTTLVSLIPFVQVVYAQPLWNAGGCGEDDILRVGHNQVGIGIWIWLLIWVWWGWEKIGASRAMSMETTTAPRMPRSARRIVASIGSIPFIVGLFFITAIGLETGPLASMSIPDEVEGAIAYGATAIVAVLVWLMIWQSAVVWSRAVVIWTVFGAVVSLWLPSALLGFFGPGLRPDAFNVTLYFLPVIGWGIWMAWTVTYWPMRAEAGDPACLVPRCMKCGYLLIGLKATRCPECGDEPTLDELWHALAGEGME